MKMSKIVMAAMAAAAVMGAKAATTPVEVSLVCTPFSIPWCDDVSGLRLNLLSGINRSVSGLDVGTFADIVKEKSAGLQLCGFYNHVGSAVGNLQVAGLLNRCDGDYKGLQLASVYNEVGETLAGASVAVMNVAKEVHGLQAGVFNDAATLTGMQFGLVNFASFAERGVQVGLVNVMPEATIPVSFLVNIGF